MKTSYMMKTAPVSTIQIFSNLKFSIYEYGVDLTSKRANIISGIIKNNGGKILNLNQSI